MEHDSQARFSPTQWTLIDALRTSDDAAREKAMASLAQEYWPPVYAHLRHAGRSREEAAELTQGFFADVVLKRKLFERADPNSFRLRTFLLHALGNYLIDDHRRKAARGPTFKLSVQSLENEESIRTHLLADASSTDPAVDFHRRWALVVLQEALSRCEKYLSTNGRQKDWQLFEARFVKPLLSGSKQSTIASLAKEIGFDTYTEAIVALRTTRKKLTGVFVPQVLAETNSSPENLDNEFQTMLSLLP